MRAISLILALCLVHSCWCWALRTPLGTALRSNAAAAAARSHAWSRGLSMVAPAGDVSERALDIKVGPLKRECLPLTTGVSMEVLSQLPSRRSDPRAKHLPPLLFIHGSYHGAWCWAEHWMPFLAGKGYETYSISLRGTSGTPAPAAAEGEPPVKSVKASEHVADLRAFMDAALPGRRPLLVAHSFGGLIVMQLLAALPDPRAALSGAAVFCSVPPSGNGPMAGRFLRERPIAAIKILVGFVLKLATQWQWLARDLFFDRALPQEDLSRYMKHFKADSQIGLDLKDLSPVLPSKSADADGRAPWLALAPPIMVAGAEKDYIVDERGVMDTAEFMGTQPEMIPLAPHDVMLGPQYVLGVSRLLSWLESQEFSRTAPAAPAR
ncbi:Alpha/Beta hydrolase protein [Tribonema minus]|uniref:Alpha/Beta hydrolase protein n=1 Tax=Tribonema minus TaxID=303371 RepID=A0A835ZC88_9STRA|nr:Alpha/Beta hydrolase protein [Tribonema minus]